MYVVRKLNGAHYFMMGFDQGPKAAMALNAIKYQEDVTVVNGSWYYFAATVMKINNFQSKQCIQFYNQFTCNTYN